MRDWKSIPTANLGYYYIILKQIEIEYPEIGVLNYNLPKIPMEVGRMNAIAQHTWLVNDPMQKNHDGGGENSGGDGCRAQWGKKVSIIYLILFSLTFHFNFLQFFFLSILPPFFSLLSEVLLIQSNLSIYTYIKPEF